MFKNLIIFCYGINLSLFSMEDNHHSFSNVFQPIKFESTDYFDDIKQKLCSYHEFKSAFEFIKENHAIMIFLPQNLVKAIMSECGYDDLYTKDHHFDFPYKLSYDSKLVLCTLSYSNLLYQETLVAKNKNNHIEPKIINIVNIEVPDDNKVDNEFHMLFNFLFDNYNGVIIGEAHSDFSARYTLCLLIPYFSEINIKKIYVEFIPIQLQNIVDDYMNSSINQMPAILATYLDFVYKMVTYNTSTYIKNYNTYTYKEIVELAKKHEIKIYGIDDEKFISLAYIKNDDFASRLVTVNQLAKECYNNDNNNEKCIIFCGQAHATTRITTNKNKIWGIRELLGFPSIFIRSSLVEPMDNDKSTGIYLNNYPEFITGTKSHVLRQQANFDIYFNCKDL